MEARKRGGREQRKIRNFAALVELQYLKTIGLARVPKTRHFYAASPRCPHSTRDSCRSLSPSKIGERRGGYSMVVGKVTTQNKQKSSLPIPCVKFLEAFRLSLRRLAKNFDGQHAGGPHAQP